MVQEYKKIKVQNLVERLRGAKAIVLVDYKGINIEQVNELRKRFRAENVDYMVQKNTLLKIALNELEITELDEYLNGPTAVAICLDDEVSPARVVSQFKKEIMEDADFPSFKAGYVAGHVFSVEELSFLAKLPTREELLGQVVGGMAAPLTGFMAVNLGIIRKFFYAVNAIIDKQADVS
ncbi:MAG: 50S ribosomal protein L10 [Candidatus Cloacimonadaceae bacterium]|jgi:large subunit ribosomal protein L10|nr:50S ribosomal protein L10 [Candidatus Cloacimonadota bacterium]MCK9242090.1 50S ribosomal protein L10 [Candidatus Cloacimonadota bacterium]MDD3103753.1 50S ribosomal protein L10 [Candidatus Cloacimonadota bacterium]MDD3533845.1 50S ribosomal protein L10 [Candidatus Cloacimonadota bacterium]MDY0126924.1 50S ribosomal protein L10 [Candidatus Cloacimonadaceae bacterium]